jgi:teichuronic acid biosynthesis glycosyltransferase TuaH
LRILYLIDPDWRWIKQRHQFLAEHLARHHSVLVIYRRHPRREIFPLNRSPVRRLPILPVPLRWGSGRRVAVIRKLWIALIAAFFRPDVLWLTDALMYSYLPARLRRLPIIYDCSDDHLCWEMDRNTIQAIAVAEARLVGCAAKVLCTSQHLQNRLIERYRVRRDDHVLLVRNGFSGEWLRSPGDDRRGAAKTSENDRRVVDLVYFGALLEWIDIESLVYCLNEIEHLRIHLIGPVELPPVRHDRLIYHGAVEHDALPAYVRPFDAFVLPFRLSPLIEAVDPIKLYEYLALEKEVFVVFYEEIRRFCPYVHFYRSAHELCHLIARFRAGTLERKSRPELTREFLRENTWAMRAKAVEAVLRTIAGPSPKAG